MSKCPAAGADLKRLSKYPAARILDKFPSRKAYSNVFQVLDICLELLSVSEKYFGLVVDDVCGVVHHKITVFATLTIFVV